MKLTLNQSLNAERTDTALSEITWHQHAVAAQRETLTARELVKQLRMCVSKRDREEKKKRGSTAILMERAPLVSFGAFVLQSSSPIVRCPFCHRCQILHPFLIDVMHRPLFL